MTEATQPTKREILKAHVNNEIERVCRINFFTGATEDNSWLEEKARALTEGIGLTPFPVVFISDRNDALTFSEEVEKEDGWKEAWSHYMALANDTVLTTPSADFPLWNNSRLTTIERLLRADRYGQLGKDIKRRLAAYIQWESIGEFMEGPNRLLPFVEVYEAGAGLIGVSNGKFGIYTPPKRELPYI